MSKAALAATRQSLVVRPVTEVYLVGVAMILLTVRGTLSLAEGLFILGMATVLILLMNVYGELLKVHECVNAQHDDLVRQIEHLIAANGEETRYGHSSVTRRTG